MKDILKSVLNFYKLAHVTNIHQKLKTNTEMCSGDAEKRSPAVNMTMREECQAFCTNR